MEYPPKNRSRLWLLQPYRKVFFVANGWWYPELLTRRRSRDPPEKVELTLVCFAKGGQNKILEYFTKEEMKFIWDNGDKIRNMFDEQEKIREGLEERDRNREHECR
ncbi:hypothetical protein Pmar_PMAR011678 [Perkinsus marinus ATCC 50983]|uniref:Uncharacterized protein n=1 Tax=Perkinsus marinus (strain ATCC 50983 / TXsc) TaxID=423536 RepID=C5LCG7_PERM5|nr:hypothetical protein Pmar_PMAR011678 [Perkinsus marinus ATCC 50983]EER05650.1 hypothetical protein Pmar_PMAR011678 [Perkinsus marinus ATCC 50983]|eukprot:XP_002773834.1 hypothetical protein Pmar_PMAR011678 [Perkinsus marinus ATCC 50983]